MKHHTVDERNPAPPGMYKPRKCYQILVYIYIPYLVTGAWCRISFINSSSEVMSHSITTISPCWRFLPDCIVPSTIAAPNAPRLKRRLLVDFVVAAPGMNSKKIGSFGLGNRTAPKSLTFQVGKKKTHPDEIKQPKKELNAR